MADLRGSADSRELILVNSRNIGVLYDVSGVFTAQSSLLTNDLVVLSDTAIRDFFGFPSGQATDIAVKVHNSSEIQTVAAKIKRFFPDTRPITRQELVKTYDMVFNWRSGMMLTVLCAAIIAFAHVFFFDAFVLAAVIKGWYVLFPDFDLIPQLNLFHLFIMVLHAAAVGGVILRRWDFSSSSAYQLSLERKTYLVSTLVNYALAFQILSFFLFIYTLEDIHNLFVGAMCATGSLNANPVGWYVLLSKIVVFFLSGLWIVLNVVDQKAEDYPLIRLKYFLLITLLPFIGLDFFLQVSYFLGLDPDIITSCCGSLFGAGGSTVTSSISTLPVRTAMLVFYSVAGLFITVMWLCLRFPGGLLRYLHTTAAAIFLACPSWPSSLLVPSIFMNFPCTTVPLI